MKLGFVLERPFMRYYSLTTGIVLILAFVSVLLGLLGLLPFQIAASFLFDAGLVLLMGQILLVITRSNRKDTLGWILGRLAYVTLLVASLSLLLMLGGIFVNSFQLLGSSSSTVMTAFSAVASTAVICFGVCLSAIGYHALREGESWRELPEYLSE